MVFLRADVIGFLNVRAPGVDAAHAANRAIHAQNGASCRRQLLVMGRVLDFLGESVEIAREGEPVKQLPLSAAEGLLLPLRILLLHASDDAATVQKSDNGYLFGFADGVTLSFSPDGLPLSVESPDLSYQIVWWERTIGDSEP